ncbi:FkbM family methyltransferase [Synechococcus sp. NB0720_010]|uniref:FkbM family methyltransferase n=1 Tax=Synechococcus sp. NB0720_010 TaxID=2907159 RepID=UPI001FF9897A|nr:FkbM family methyltransferase [Synechococcus sp. NB0720_010]UPH89127.1 FkbM family methyltransferase [Synechococcus sp. NB0720_010]
MINSLYYSLPASLRRVAFKLVALSLRPFKQITISRNGLTYCLDLSSLIELLIFLDRYEPDTRQALAKLLKPSDVAIDIGANIGAHTLSMASLVGTSGCVIAIEPTSVAFERLTRNISKNPSLKIHPIKAFVARANSLLPPSVQSIWPSSSNHPSSTNQSTTDGAFLLPLDEVLRYLDPPMRKVDLIKIDVDGYELEALSSGLTLLQQFKPIVVAEAWSKTISQGTEHIFTLLEDLGYYFYDTSLRPLTFQFPPTHWGPELYPEESFNIVCVHKDTKL